MKREDRPGDTITSIQWSPTLDPNNTHFALSSWDCSVRLYQFSYQNQPPQAKAMVSQSSPVLDTCFNQDGSNLFLANADGTVQVWNIASGSTQTQPVGRHDQGAACKSLKWIPEMNMLVTGGWDNKINYWDLRQQAPVETVMLKERVHCMAVRGNWMVVCGGTTFPVYLFNISQNRKFPIRDRVATQTQGITNTHPKLALRTCAISTDSSFYVCAGIEGRVHVNFIDDRYKSKNFVYRAHKTEVSHSTSNPIKYHVAIHDIKFHPQTNIFSSIGADGAYYFWDQSERSRTHYGPQLPSNTTMSSDKPTHKTAAFPGDGSRPAPIISSAFNADGSVFAYAVGYDWSSGAGGNQPAQQVNTVMFHKVSPNELKKKNYGGYSGSKS